MRDKIWKMVHDLIDECHDKYVCEYEGIKEHEDEVADIIANIEGLAAIIENKIVEKLDYEANDAKEDEGCRKYHKNAEEGL